MENPRSSTLYEDWNRIQAAFPTRKALLPNWAVFHGISTRLGNNRLKRMMSGPSSNTLKDILNSASDERVKALRVMADVNHEQASAAFKLTMIANVSAPLAFAALLHQLLPGGLSQIWSFIEDEGEFFVHWNLGLAIVVSIILVVVVTFALGSLGQSRDIKNLIDIYAAERGIFFGLEDSETA